MWLFQKPAEASIQTFLARQSQYTHSYSEVGLTRAAMPTGYDRDHHRIRLGRGRAAFEAACAAVRHWRMFPGPWTEIYPSDTPIEVSRVVAILARACGVWWMNACRIVYVIDEAESNRRFGFAYGTLPGHVECGEERFMVEWDPADIVWYDVRAFSRPRYWPVRLGYPWARRLQRRFVRESQSAMRQNVAPFSSLVGEGRP